MKSRSFLPLLLLLAAGCDGPERLYAEWRLAFGSVRVELQILARGRAAARRAADAAFDALTQTENLLSTHLPGSEISKLNRSSGRPCHLSRQTLAVLRRALAISRLSGGAFDVTAGPLIRLWKQTIRTGTLPDPGRLDAARKRVGYRHVSLGENTAALQLDGMSVDLGGIAKGYGVDQAVRALRAAGIRSALIDAGGDGYALGTRPDGTPWRIGIRNPAAPSGKRLARPVLLLSDLAYATSGDYEQYTEIDGIRYAHIIDPRTGRPARQAASVTVIAPDCTTADALATAVSVLGPEAGLRLIDRLPGVECLVITREGGGLRRHTSRGFHKYVAP